MEEEASLLSDDEHAVMSSTAEVPTDGVAGVDGAEQPAEGTATAEAAADAETPTADAPAPAAVESHDAAQAAGHEAAEADASKAKPADPPSSPADAEAAAQQMPGRRRLTLVLRYVVNPASLLPLYSAVIDMDLHPHLGQPLKVGCAKGTVNGDQLLQTAAVPWLCCPESASSRKLLCADAEFHHMQLATHDARGCSLPCCCRRAGVASGDMGQQAAAGAVAAAAAGPRGHWRRQGVLRAGHSWRSAGGRASRRPHRHRCGGGSLQVCWVSWSTKQPCPSHAQLCAGCLASFVSRRWP